MKQDNGQTGSQKNKKEKGTTTFLKIILIAAAAAVLAYVLLVGMICVKESRVRREVPDMDDIGAIIVLGAEVHPDGEPSVQLAWRLDKAVEAWNRARVPIVVCGAQSGHEPII